MSPPLLALPLPTGKLWLDTDVSYGQLGTFLLQENSDGQTLPLGFWSRTLNPAERNYSTTERECLAIVWAVTHLRTYLEGNKFTVRTDHHALRWVMNLSDAQGHLARWRLRISEFDLKSNTIPAQHITRPMPSHGCRTNLSHSSRSTSISPFFSSIRPRCRRSRKFPS
jgi:RNase H-like domain found in reverse transcriptase